MRIEKLDLIAYGPFSSTQLDFGQVETGGLHLVYGPNEAGKSSALTAVLDFLFGFQNRSASTFQHPSQKVRVGATLSHNGQRLSLVRRKGRKATLLSADSGEPFDDSHLERFLYGLDRKRYESEFGISYAQLVAGGRELASGKGDLASALFAVAAGSQQWLAVRRNLEENAKKLFLSRGSLPKINALIETIADQKKQLGEMQLLPNDWDRRQSDLLELESIWKKADNRLVDLQERSKRLEYEGKLRPLLIDYWGCRQRFLETNVQWLPDDESFEQWETELETLEEDLVLAVDRSTRIKELQASLAKTNGPFPVLELASEIEQLVEERARFNDLSRALIDTCQTHLKLNEDLLARREQLKDQFGDLDSPVVAGGDNPGSPETAESATQASSPQQTTFWDETTEDTNCWYATTLSDDQKQSLDEHSNLIEKNQAELQSVEAELKSLKQKRSTFELATRASGSNDLIDDELAKKIESFLDDHSQWPSSLRLQKEWRCRRERMESECESIVSRVPEFEGYAWKDIRQWEWPEPRATESFLNEYKELVRLKDDCDRQCMVLREKLSELRESLSKEEAIAGDASYEELVSLVERSTELVSLSLADPMSLQKVAVESLADDINSQFAVFDKLESQNQSAIRLSKIHRWLIFRLIEVNRIRVEKSDQLAKFRQRQQERIRLEDQLKLKEEDAKQLDTQVQAKLDRWNEWFATLPVTIAIERILLANQALIRVREMGSEVQDLLRREQEVSAQWETAEQQLLLLSKELPETVDSANADIDLATQSSSVDQQLQQLKSSLDQWRRFDGQNRQSLVQVESLRQRINEVNEKLCDCRETQEALQIGWLKQLQNCGLPETLTVQQFHVWCNSNLELDELEAEQNRVAARMKTLRSELAEYVGVFAKIQDQFGGGKPLSKSFKSDFSQLSMANWLTWQENWTMNMQQIDGAVRKWKIQLAEQQRNAMQRDEWATQLQELVNQAGQQLELISKTVQDLLQRIQSIGAGFRLKQDLDIDALELQQFSLLVPELRRKFIAIEQLMDDASILDSRLEGIAKLDGIRLLESEYQTIDSIVESEADLPTSSTSARNDQWDDLQAEILQQKKLTLELANRLAVKRREIDDLRQSTKAAEMHQAIEMNLAELDELCEQYLDYSLSAVLLDETMTRHSQLNQHPILARATECFEQLTLGSFRGLKTELDSSGRKVLLGERRDTSTVEIQGLSEGTETQLYLALRIAALEHFLSNSEALPFVVDDVLKDYDDQRALAALKVFAELGKKTQVILFTHHEHLLGLVGQNLDSTSYQVHQLQSGHAKTTVS